MAGIFGTRAGILYDASLVAQFIIILVLMIGRRLARGKQLIKHGFTMTIATILHLASVLLVMVPSIARNSQAILQAPTGTGALITLAHATTGASSLTLAVYIVGAWRLRATPSACFRRRKLMKPLLVLWTLTLVLGISFYVYYYV
ncbi:hypothetical protein MUP00_04240 [Candidatus Bathyarchaeota archaeon]|jgi:hypothetical protein|nr:hypothetical protein [Candidatus Bathyarchaeota archaeon]